MNNENVRHCEHCGTEIHGEDYTEFDGELLCPSCLSRETLICTQCGERIWRDDNAGNSYTVLSQECFLNF